MKPFKNPDYLSNGEGVVRRGACYLRLTDSKKPTSVAQSNEFTRSMGIDVSGK